MTERLRTTGFLFTQTEIGSAVLSADYGDAYRSPGAVIGAGLRKWTARIEVLPDDGRGGFVEGQARASYLWDFWHASKANQDAPFWLYDYKSDLFYLASFSDDDLTFEMLCDKVFSTGLNFRERRIVGVTSPIAGFPILDESGAAILDEQTGDELLEEGIY